MAVLLYILLALAVIITLVLFLNLNLILKFEKEVQVRLRVLCFSFDAMSLINGGSNANKTKKNKKTKNTSKPKQKRKNTFEDFIGFVDLIVSMAQMIAENLTSNLKINLKKLKAVIASDEADKTAYMYGAASNAVAIMLDAVPNFVKKFKKNDKNIAVYPDYTAEKCIFEAEVVITLKVRHLLIILFRALGLLNESARKNIRKKGI